MFTLIKQDPHLEVSDSKSLQKGFLVSASNQTTFGTWGAPYPSRRPFVLKGMHHNAWQKRWNDSKSRRRCNHIRTAHGGSLFSIPIKLKKEATILYALQQWNSWPATNYQALPDGPPKSHWSERPIDIMSLLPIIDNMKNWKYESVTRDVLTWLGWVVHWIAISSARLLLPLRLLTARNE